MKYYDILLIFCLKYEVTSMSNTLLESVNGYNLVVELYKNDLTGLFHIELREPITYKILNVTCYSDYDKAMQHLAVYRT